MIDFKEEFLNNILNNLYEGIYIVDRNKKIAFWNKGAEIITGYASEEVLGEKCKGDILIFSDDNIINLCKGQCPLAETIEDGLTREKEVYLQHKDGHKVPVRLKAIPLRGTGGRIDGVIEMFRDNSSRVADLEKVEQLEKLALLDPLTGLANRRYIEMVINSRLNEVKRYGWLFGIISMGTDNFSSITRLYGGDVGEKVLKMVAKNLVNSSRPFDMIGRYEDEKFVAVITNVNENNLYTVATRFLGLVEQSSFPIGSKIVRITLSAGAVVADPEDATASLLARADQLMAQSKAAGGNRLTMKME